MKAMCVVAHPDDCVIFAYSFMHAHSDYEWTVCYLTYTKDDARGLEFFNFWHRRGIKTRFLGYQDDWHDIQNDRISFDEDSARKDLQLAIADQDLILTHDDKGDYGHIHHVFVNRATADHPNRITFAGPGQGTVKYTIESGVYALSELPMHQEIIATFHPVVHTNEYKL
jgi:LmbE family N-acetylglucosaminyl deacetylase